MSAEGPYELTLAQVLTGLRCPKALWLHLHHPERRTLPERRPPMPASSPRQVDQAARARFPGGVLIEAPSARSGEALAATQAAFGQGARMLYRPAFLHEGIFLRADIVYRGVSGDGWKLIAVRASTDVKASHLKELALQLFAMRGSGLRVDKVGLLRLNPDCLYPRLSELFILEDVTEAAQPLQRELAEPLERLRRLRSAGSCPKTAIGPHCLSPGLCPFQDRCWKDNGVPAVSVLDLPALSGARKWELVRQGFLRLEDLPPVRLTALQRRMVDCTRTGRRLVNAEGIRRRLASWTYPLHFLDFEMTAPAIPRYPGLRPFEPVPVLFSGLTVQAPGGAPWPIEYLHREASDPRPGLVEALLASVGARGSVVVYNKSAEGRCLAELAAFLPHQAPRLLAIRHRLVDLLPVVRSCVYDPAFAGRFTLEAVAPVLLGPAAGYGDLAIAGGVAAQAAYEEMVAEETPAELRAERREALLACGRQDTLNLARLVEWLRTAGGDAIRA